MTTPGPNDPTGSGPQDPNAGQSGQGWGQQPPPSGPPQPGQAPQQIGQQGPPQFGQQGQPGQFGQQGPQQGQPGQFGQPGQQGGFGQDQQGQPWAGAGASGQGPVQPEKPSWKKRLPLVIGAVVVALAVAFGRNALGGGGEPEIGDCITQDGSSYETVDCDDAEAQYRVIGTDEDMTQAEFYDDPDTCAAVAAESDAASGVALWSGSDPDEDGSVYCAEAI
ncbi:hypothetical protein ASG36_18200 [Geodermatophilus sp. Leaf369]|uniref:LppU/SCO3897 family protein n=1 Tax=Geodermatophilus sp. Leaf369 TaxID=1736354 RepID=UPI0006F97C30|nr:hypothetical protein [Geodermatophilus sp. Leaf369]KQS56929.1 hypothetical protein ASG36_18200 [Geodermatophilus sp. Leaf369]